MKKTLLVIATIVALPLALFAADRVVVLELFCRTACEYCPGAAIGADAVSEDHGEDILTVEYHLNDPFMNEASIIRALYYQDEPINIPCAIFDGVIKYVGPDAASNYEQAFQTRKEKAAPLEISLDKTEDAYLSQGTLIATITNSSEEAITGVVHFTITESNIPYSWIHSKSWVHFCLRDMLPDADGAEITLAAGADTSISRDYEINPLWPNHTDDLGNIEFGCLVQDTAVYSGKLKEIFQGAVIPLINPLTVGEELVAEPTYDWQVVTRIGPRIVLRFAGANRSRSENRSQVSVFDASGRKVDDLSLTGNQVLIWGDGFNPGVYFIVADIDGNRQTKKVILVR